MKSEALNTIKTYVVEIRTYQWIKNSFIVAPLLFARKLFVLHDFLIAIAVFFLFSLLTGAVYVINDILDIQVDRMHPSKKNRPIAAGLISIKAARIYFVILTIVGLFPVLFINVTTFLLFLTYFILNILYSIKLKHVVFIDVIIIASGFMLRVLIGATALNIFISNWLIVCTFLLSLFLGFGKRRHELVLMHNTGVKKRKVLESYNLKQIDWFIYIVGAITAVAYLFYTISARTITFFHTHAFVYTSVFILFGLYRYTVILKNKENSASPTDLMIKDRLFLLNLLLWVISVVFIIYGGMR